VASAMPGSCNSLIADRLRPAAMIFTRNKFLLGHGDAIASSLRFPRPDHRRAVRILHLNPVPRRARPVGRSAASRRCPRVEGSKNAGAVPVGPNPAGTRDCADLGRYRAYNFLLATQSQPNETGVPTLPFGS
jgi:hypothetical protein